MSQAEWAAASDLLFDLFSKPFFESLLKEIQIHHHFLVVTTDQDRGFRADNGGRGCGELTRHFCSQGFPPFAVYVLDDDGIPGETVFMTRPAEIYYRRIFVGTDGQVRSYSCENDPAYTGRFRVVQFFAAAGYLSRQQAADLFDPDTNIVSSDADQAASEIEAILDKQAASIQALIARVQQRGVAASGLRFTIKVTVNDARRDRTKPLPAIPAHEIVIP